MLSGWNTFASVRRCGKRDGYQTAGWKILWGFVWKWLHLPEKSCTCETIKWDVWCFWQRVEMCCVNDLAWFRAYHKENSHPPIPETVKQSQRHCDKVHTNVPNNGGLMKDNNSETRFQENEINQPLRTNKTRSGRNVNLPRYLDDFHVMKAYIFPGMRFVIWCFYVST